MRERNPQAHSLSSELGMEPLPVQAGYHDFDSVSILPEFSGDILVARHEAVHDEMLTHTPFGITQFIFKQLQKSATSQEVRSNAEIWLEQLCHASLETHESTATYLSVKSFPSEAQTKLLSLLTKEYRYYFRNLADVVDTAFHSSYLQYIVGKTIAEACFSSRLPEFLCCWSLDLKVQIEQNNQPDKRLKALLQAISGNLCELAGLIGRNLKNKDCKFSLPDNFDFQSESDWLSLTFDTGFNLDAYLLSISRRKIYGIAKTLWPCLFDEEMLDCIKKFINVIGNRTDTNLLASVLVLEHPSKDDETRMKANRSGLTTIENKRVASRVKLGYLDNTRAPVDVLMSPQGSKVFITKTVLKKRDDLLWNRFVDSDSKVIGADTLSHALMKKALVMRKILAEKGFPIPSIDLIVVGLHSDSPATIASAYNEIIGYHTIKLSDGPKCFELDRILWYLGGDFLWWYENLMSSGKLEFFMINSRERVAEAVFSRLTLEQVTMREVDQITKIVVGGPDWFVFRNLSLGGLFLRILPAGSNEGIIDILHNDVKKGKLKRIEDTHEKKEIANTVLKARIPIMLSWEEY